MRERDREREGGERAIERKRERVIEREPEQKVRAKQRERENQDHIASSIVIESPITFQIVYTYLQALISKRKNKSTESAS